jgi:hypothetical protein
VRYPKSLLGMMTLDSFIAYDPEWLNRSVRSESNDRNYPGPASSRSTVIRSFWCPDDLESCDLFSTASIAGFSKPLQAYSGLGLPMQELRESLFLCCVTIASGFSDGQEGASSASTTSRPLSSLLAYAI